MTIVWEDKSYDVITEEGFPQSIASRDFMFDKADAVTSDGTTITPRKGDRITLTENGIERAYDILPVAELPAVEEMDGQYRWKVHTKQVR